MSPKPSVLQIFNESGESLPSFQNEAEKVLRLISEKEHSNFKLVELVYVDESDIIRINKEYLDRDYVTDIISFQYHEDKPKKDVEGTLYCCAPRIKEQASELNEDEKKEFLRVFIHGLLHLIGYNDQASDEKKEMTGLENHYLQSIGLN